MMAIMKIPFFQYSNTEEPSTDSQISHRGIFGILCLTLLLYIPSLHNGYIEIDTPWLVVENPILSRGMDKNIAFTLQQIWLDLDVGTRLTLGAEYLPVRDMSVLLDWWIFGDNWLFHHIHSLFYYLCSIFLLWKINIRLFGTNTITWWGTLLFAILPVHVESVAWLASRKDVLSLCLGLWAVYIYLENKRLLVPTFLLILSYWAKNTAIVFAPLLFILAFLHHREKPTDIKSWLGFFGQWLAPAVVLFALLYITMHVGSSVAMFAHARGSTSLETWTVAGQTWIQYASMLIYPNRLSLFYPEPTPIAPLSLSHISANMLLLSLVAGTIFAVYRNIHQASTHTLLLALGSAMIIFGLLPVSQITPIQNLIADRYLLLPSIGYSWLCMALAHKLSSMIHNPLQWTIRCTVLLWFGWLGYGTWQRNILFQDTLLLWTDVTNKYPEEIRAWTSVIAISMEKGDAEFALQQLEHAQHLFPNSPELHQSAGNIYLQQHNPDQAIQEFTVAWQGNNDLRVSANNLMLLYKQNKDHQQALKIGKELTQLHPLYEKGWNGLGAVCLDIPDLECARHAFHKALSLAPYSTTTHTNLGTLAYKEENWTEAEYWWSMVLEKHPDNAYARAGIAQIQTILSNTSP